ncbi:MAG: nuclear transport factor 2 family protein [Halieaceae bacterium]|uniref:nuclear transport factor 2 family protein n=1 Tax=Haliea alexandrii TaxID=2448162 RepID=UPI000F0B68C1|nr:nuclear transport factor 2 family protein [Haliea alexandrii]MCR9185168.1 nuclear transport factor 2 family protein [Halieaceae bacterium]
MSNHSAAPQASLQTLLDKQAIRELKYRYLNACDDKAPETVAACFAPGPVAINFGHIGEFANREDFVAVFVALGCHEHIVDMHHAENMIVEMTGADSASARVGLRFHSINTRDQTTVQLGGFYNDEYRRINGEWLISASTFTVRSALITDYSSGSDAVVWAGNQMPSQAA